MAIFSKLILGSTLLSSVALAAPFGVLFDVKPAWTVYETDYTTIDMTTTIYINDATTKPTVSTTAPVETSSSSVVSTSVPSTTMSTSVIPIASPASVFTPSTSSVAPATTSAAAVNPAPAATTPSTTSVAVVPTSSAAATPSLAGKDVASGPTSASDSATCQGEGSACLGDITYYSGGLGACGVNVDPNGNGIALPAAYMGAQSNGNPYCGKTMTIYNPATGQSAQGVVMDKCPGCTGRSIDMMESLMNSLTNNQAYELGRVAGVEWWFN